MTRRKRAFMIRRFMPLIKNKNKTVKRLSPISSAILRHKIKTWISRQMSSLAIWLICILFQKSAIGFLILMWVIYSILLHLPPLRFHFGGWDRTQHCCDFGTVSQTNYSARSDPQLFGQIMIQNRKIIVVVNFNGLSTKQSLNESGRNCLLRPGEDI